MTLRRPYTLFYYDGPQVFVCKDAYDTNYLCVAVDADDFEGDTGIEAVAAIGTRISLASLKQVSYDEITVGEYFRRGEAEFFALTETVEAEYSAVQLQITPNDHFPDTDFLLDPSRETASEKQTDVTSQTEENVSNVAVELARLSLRDNNLAIRLKMSKNGHLGIEAEHLGAVTSLYTKTFSRIENKIAGTFGQSTLVAELAMGASFDLYITSRRSLKHQQTLFPGFQQSDAITLEYLHDILMSSISDGESLKQLYRIKGHALASLKGLLTYIKSQGILIIQQGYNAESNFFTETQFEPGSAERILSTIMSTKDLETDLSDYQGHFSLADSEKGRWRFVSDDGQVFSGTADATFLSGVTIDSVHYTARIRQEISVDLMGKETSICLLDSVPIALAAAQFVAQVEG